MNKWSDLSWLPLSDRKNIDLPNIVYEIHTDQNYGGYYEYGTKTLVVVLAEEHLIPATIAHEFCHYLQYIRGIPFTGSSLDLFEKFEYTRAIRMYFRSQPKEMEALLYESKVAKNERNTFWLNGLVLPN